VNMTATKERHVTVQRLLIQIRLPDGHWAGDVTRKMPHTILRIEEHMPLSKGRGTAKAIVIGSEVRACPRLLDEHTGIEGVVIHEEREDLTTMDITINRGGGGFLEALSAATVVPATPFNVRDGWVEWEFKTDQAHAQILINRLKESAIPHRILSFGAEKSDRLLTPRQREIFDLAVKEGYYESPRRITLTGLAEKVGISKSTACEIVHLIENRIISTFKDSIRQLSPRD